MDDIVFSSTTEVMEAFGKLMGRPQILDLPVNEAGLNAWIERQKSGNPLEAAHEWAVGYRERHRKKRRGPSVSTLWARILPQRKRMRKIYNQRGFSRSRWLGARGIAYFQFSRCGAHISLSGYACT